MIVSDDKCESKEGRWRTEEQTDQQVFQSKHRSGDETTGDVPTYLCTSLEMEDLVNDDVGMGDGSDRLMTDHSRSQGCCFDQIRDEGLEDAWLGSLTRLKEIGKMNRLV